MNSLVVTCEEVSGAFKEFALWKGSADSPLYVARILAISWKMV